MTGYMVSDVQHLCLLQGVNCYAQCENGTMITYVDTHKGNFPLC